MWAVFSSMRERVGVPSRDLDMRLFWYADTLIGIKDQMNKNEMRKKATYSPPQVLPYVSDSEISRRYITRRPQGNTWMMSQFHGIALLLSRHPLRSARVDNAECHEGHRNVTLRDWIFMIDERKKGVAIVRERENESKERKYRKEKSSYYLHLRKRNVATNSSALIINTPQTKYDRTNSSADDATFNHGEGIITDHS
ncbi:hypothetical protein SCHPADRAFT_893206 [Schizopora paradoxa]|uniref:Uncharacterized protein n=1 Tax=Schizopora paradoxa TaxID=27342 RepID=A0A0H2RWU6_9AGAM|nr:hypothetical protein SCHPADRAFT_893206 [Schizopora paradoxa]